DGKIYQNWIYADDGYLQEIFVEKGYPVDIDDGQSILEMQALDIEKKNGIYFLTVTDQNGKATSSVIYPKCSSSPAE
ncbi:MAG: DUF4860 domain-containing protein, partial [Clostridiales bacterium]